MNQVTDNIAVGQRVTVTQQVQHKGWTIAVTGVVEAIEQRKTGSWFAHAKDDKLWLDRLVLRKDDGEIVVCNLDRYSRVDVEAATAAVPATADKAPLVGMTARGSLPDAHAAEAGVGS